MVALVEGVGSRGSDGVNGAGFVLDLMEWSDDSSEQGSSGTVLWVGVASGGGGIFYWKVRQADSCVTVQTRSLR